jgi:hypothetical protein
MHILLASLLEGKFKNRKNQIHLFDAPMFSVYIGDGVSKKDLYNIKRGEKRIKAAFEKARQQIHSMGFGSIHANVLIKDLSNYPNQNTGTVDVGGLAYSKGKYMEIASSQFSSTNTDYLVRIIVHEWAHLWMFNNSKEFKNSVNTLYNRLVSSGAEKIKPEDIKSRLELSNEEYQVMISQWQQIIVRLVTGNNTFKVFASKNMPDADVQPVSWSNTITDATEKDVEHEVVKTIKAGFIRLCIDNNFAQPSLEIQNKVEEIARNAVVPKLIELGKNPELYKNISIPNSVSSLYDYLYDYLWLSNDLKPKGFSITSIIQNLKAPAAINKVKDEFSGGISGKNFEFHRKYLKNIHNWVSDYGMSNSDEMWATGIEEFFKLPLPHRKSIIKLMMNMGAK